VSLEEEGEEEDEPKENVGEEEIDEDIFRKETLSAELEDDGLEFVADWVAYKLKQYPSLGRYSYLAEANHSYTAPSWVQQLSFGGLKVPSVEWLEEVRRMNQFFKEYHPLNNFKKIKHVTSDTLNTYVKDRNTSFLEEALRLFFRLRLFIRIKFINSCHKLLNLQPKRKNHNVDKNDQSPFPQ
jgi:hypothetical protein